MSKKDSKSTVNITNNFNAPIGQHIDHVDHISFQMDGEGNFHFGQVEQVEQVSGTRLTPQRLGQAVKAVQQLMWGKSAYAVLFCVLRDRFGYPDNMSQFERDIEKARQTVKLTYDCPKGTISDAFRNNPILKKPIETWEKSGTSARYISLWSAFYGKLMV
jgi:hypothetical protein